MASSQVTKNHILVAAIDFGTTFTGWAYQFRHDYNISPTMVFSKNWNNGTNISYKAPTTVLIKPDGKTFDSFGYDAEDKFAELTLVNEQNAWFYFSHFKMKLFDTKKIHLNMMLDAQNKKRLSARLVFSLTIEYMKKDLMDQVQKQLTNDGIQDRDVLWVLTVPAIWNDTAKQFMRQAAMDAGIERDNLLIALEPEAASVYCKQLSLDPSSGMEGTTVGAFSPCRKYLVIDAGGGTIDMNVHEVMPDDNLRELHKPTGNNWGGTTVGKAFEAFLCQLFGRSVMNKFKEQHLDDYLAFLRLFEVKKREVSVTKEKLAIFALPFMLVKTCETETGSDVATAISQSSFARNINLVQGNKLKIESSVMRGFFKESIDNIISQVETVLKDQRMAGCSTILMVGGYSEADILREAIKEEFPHMDVVTPSEASLAILKGAVIYGRNPQVITSRVCKYTYGVGISVVYYSSVHPESKKYVDAEGVVRAKDVFDKIVEVGQDVTPGHSYRGDYLGKPASKDPAGYASLYASTQTDPSYTDDEGCFRVGRIPYDHKDKHGNISRIMYILQFGGTEIEVTNLYETTGEEVKTTVRLPD